MVLYRQMLNQMHSKLNLLLVLHAKSSFASNIFAFGYSFLDCFSVCIFMEKDKVL